MSGILWLYPIQWLFIISAPGKDVTEASQWLFINSGHEKKKTLSFNLVKVH